MSKASTMNTEKRVRKNFAFIMENLDCKDLLDFLIQDNILTLKMVDEILSFNPNTRENRNRIFFQFLHRSGPTGYDLFLTALDKSGNGFIADRITATELDDNDSRFSDTDYGLDVLDGSGERSRLQKLIDKTMCEIESWKENDGNLYIETPSLQKCRDILKSKGHVCILGLSGDGKTTLAYQLLIESSRPIIILRSAEFWEDIDTSVYQPIIMLDDFLGRFEMDKRLKENWLRNIVSIYSCVQKGQLQVIATCREAIFSQCEQELGSYPLFHPLSRVHLSGSDCELSTDVKLKMIKTYVTSKIAFPEIAISKNKNEENLAEYKISEETLERVADTTTNLGFPQCCRVFVTNPLCFCKGVAFFERPTEVLLQEIDRMGKSRNETDTFNFCALSTVLIFGGLIEDRIFDENHTRLRDIATTCGIPTTTPVCKHFRLAAERLSTSYLTRTDDTFTFKHSSLAEAVFTSLFNSHPKLLIERCHFRLLKNMITSGGGIQTSDSLCTLVTQYQYELFSGRLIREIIQNGSIHGRLREVTSHRVFDDKKFVDMFWIHLNSRPKMKSDVLTATDMFGESILSVSVASSGYFVENLIVALKESLPLERFQSLVKDALYSTCMFGNYDVYKSLTVNCNLTPESRCLEAAVDYGRSEIVAEMAKNKHWTHDELQKLLYGACSSGNYALYKSLTTECHIIPDVTCLEVAVVRKRCNIIKDLVTYTHWTKTDLTDGLGTACYLCAYECYKAVMTCDVKDIVTKEVLKSAAEGARKFNDDRIVKDLTSLGFQINKNPTCR